MAASPGKRPIEQVSDIRIGPRGQVS